MRLRRHRATFAPAERALDGGRWYMECMIISSAIFSLTFAAAIGSAPIAAIFFAFSTFIMAGFGRIPPEQGTAAMQSVTGNSFLYILIAGVAANAVWRLAGLALSSGISEEGPVIAWVKAVSTALIAGLVARIVIFPPGALAQISMPVRVGAFILGIAVFYAARRHLGLGILAAVLCLISAHLLGG